MNVPQGKPWRLAVKAVLFDTAGRCLLLRRSAANKGFVGKWEWPGGKVDPGEDFAAAVVRETKEETNLDVEITGLAGVTNFEMPKLNIVLLCMEARITGGEFKLSDEHDAFAWVALADIPRYEYPPRISELMVEYATRKATVP